MKSAKIDLKNTGLELLNSVIVGYAEIAQATVKGV